MPKSVCRAPRIEVGGVDVTRWFVGVHIPIVLGELNTCELTLVDDPQVVEITKDPRKAGFAINDTVMVGGVDISHWVSGYIRTVQIGMCDTVTLNLQCDPKLLRINGTTPWVDAGDELTTYEVDANLRAARQHIKRMYS